MITNTQPITNLRDGESVMFFPSYGRQVDDGRTWKVNICGAVIEPENVRMHKRLLLRLLNRVLKATPEELDSDVFKHRIRAFAAATERGKRVAIRIGPRIYRLQKKSQRNGHFRGTLRLSAEEVERLAADGHLNDGCLRFEVFIPNGDDRKFTGSAHLLSPTGVSIISDVDDTIKLTEVTSRQALLANTFLRQFTAIDGMASLYQSWAKHGARFHYVTSSPWQLYDPLAELCETEGFPQGTFHLRTFRLRDHMLRRVLLIRRRGKGSVIKGLLTAFPQRRFILVGDSGEIDPELYGNLTRKFPQQIESVLIRQLAARPLTSERQEKAFRRLPESICKSFEHAGEIADSNVVT